MKGKRKDGGKFNKKGKRKGWKGNTLRGKKLETWEESFIRKEKMCEGRKGKRESTIRTRGRQYKIKRKNRRKF